MLIFSVLGLRLRCHNVQLFDLSPLELGIPAMLELDVLMKVSTVASTYQECTMRRGEGGKGKERDTITYLIFTHASRVTKFSIIMLILR
jgi:hypothetical protein